MSIINQALKKAQREQLLRESHAFPGHKHAASGGQPRAWFVLTAGFAMALGLGAIFHAWFSMQTGRSDTVDAAPELAQSAAIVTLYPVPVPAPFTPPIEAGHAPPSLLPTPAPGSAPVPSIQLGRETAPAAPLAPRPPRPLPALASVATPARSAPSQSTPPLIAASAESGQRHQPQAQNLFNQALVVQAAGDVEHARRLLEQAVRLDPTFKVAYNSLGSLYYQQQQYQQAIVMYERALALDPQYAKARNNLGSTYLRLAMDEQALTELHKALQADSAYGLAYYNIACVYARAGDSATAAEYLQQAIAFEPQARIWAQTDNDFSPVRATPVVQKLLGP